MEPAVLTLLLGGCGGVVPPAVCEHGYIVQGLYDPVSDACLVGALADCSDAVGGWVGTECPTLETYAATLGPLSLETAACGCTDRTGARYDRIDVHHFYDDGGQHDRLLFAAGVLRWALVNPQTAEPVCCKPSGHPALWMSFGTPVPGLDCTAAVEDTSVGPYDAICDGL